MKLRWFRTAFWTLIACLGATTLLVLWAPLQASQMEDRELAPSLVEWPNGAGPVNVASPASEAGLRRCTELQQRLDQMETRVTRLTARMNRYPDVPYVDRSETINAQAGMIAALGLRLDEHENLLSGRVQSLDDLEARLASLQSNFDAHVALPVEPTEARTTLMLLSLPIPVSGPPVPAPTAPAFPGNPDEYTPLDLEVEHRGESETRTATISVRRAPLREPHGWTECGPCWVGPCPRCGRYHGLVYGPNSTPW